VNYKIFWSDRKVIAEQRLAVRSEAERQRYRAKAMKKTAAARVRSRIRARLEELGMTARELADAAKHKDAWISGILSGYQSLGLEDFDAVADKLGLSPSELVRHDDAVVRELTPREMRLLKHYQDWPPTMQDRWLEMLDHFAATVPDRETATLLERLRRLPKGLRRAVLAWLYRSLEEGIPPDVLDGGAPELPDAAPIEPSTPRQSRRTRKSSESSKNTPPTPPLGK
jgi:transcriptional regulator with XRE-family HTH domain